MLETIIIYLVGIDGHAVCEGPIEQVVRTETRKAEDLLKKLDILVGYTY